jgi:hypothetical protein
VTLRRWFNKGQLDISANEPINSQGGSREELAGSLHQQGGRNAIRRADDAMALSSVALDRNDQSAR